MHESGACQTRCRQQRLIQRRQGQVLAHRELKISSIVDGKVVLFCQRVDLRPDKIFVGCVDSNRKDLEVLEKLVDIAGSDAPAASSHPQRIGDFQGPMGGHDGLVAGSQPGQQRFGRFSGFIGKAPGQRRRSVDNKDGH